MLSLEWSLGTQQQASAVRQHWGVVQPVWLPRITPAVLLGGLPALQLAGWALNLLFFRVRVWRSVPQHASASRE